MQELRIDMSACVARGLCSEVLAPRLGRDEWGYPWAVDESGRGTTRMPLAAGEERAAREAARLCPVRALLLTRVTPAA
jgi:ferredoxin